MPDTNQPATNADFQKLEKRFQNLEDLTKKIATKADLKHVEKNLRTEILRVEGKVEQIEDGQKRLQSKADKIINTLDGFVARVDNLTVDNQVGTHQTRELRVQVDDHEKKIKHLESQHIENQ